MDKFLIGPQTGTLQTDLKPWAIPDDSFAYLNNAYVFRGRIRKRFGSLLMNSNPLLSRLRVQVGTYSSQTSPVPGIEFNIGQLFSVGNDQFTVYQTGTPAAMLSTNANASGTFNTTTGAFTITYSSGAPGGGTPVYWYPALPVMGLTNYEFGPINNQPSYAFDTQFAYLYSTGWSRSGTLQFLLPNNLNYVWTTNWEGITPNTQALFATNFQVTNPNGSRTATDDPIWYTPDGSTWYPLNAQGTAPAGSPSAFYFLPTGLARYTGPYVLTAKIIVPFKDRLLLLNTIENNNPNGNGTAGTNTAYPNRCRFSFNGSPFAQNAWYEPNTSDTSATGGGLSNAAGAGWIDATTDEQIVSCEFIKDRLIVYFERSTWELAYTGNDKQPFLWQKLNTELGADSTFSVVPFDREILCISNVGVHACNGSNVQRIDKPIPEEIFNINVANGYSQRVAGVRDYKAECVYWAFPQKGFNFTYNNKFMVYNYANGSWALGDDCINSWGYYEQQTDTTWASSVPTTWQEATYSWNSGVIQAEDRQVIAGNQQGFTFLCLFEVTRNAPAMQLTQLTNAGGFLTLTIIDHTLSDAVPGTGSGGYILIENAQGVTNLNNGIYPIWSVIDSNTVTIQTPLTFSGTYTGGGTITRVSNPQIQSKQWNPYDKQAKDVQLAKIDFLVDNTFSGQVTVEYMVSAAQNFFITQESEPGVIMGDNILSTAPFPDIPFEAVQARLWHPVYFQADGQSVQIYIYMSHEQMQVVEYALADLQIHALVLHTKPSSYYLR